MASGKVRIAYVDDIRGDLEVYAQRLERGGDLEVLRMGPPPDLLRVRKEIT